MICAEGAVQAVASGAGVGVGMLRGAGIPLLENKKGFLVPWVLMFHGFQDLEDSSRFHYRKIPFCLKTLGEANCFGPEKNNIFEHIQLFVKRVFDLVGITDV